MKKAAGLTSNPVGVVFPDGFQQRTGAKDVGADEVGRPVDRAVHMGLRRQVHEGVRAEVEQEPAQPLGIANVQHLKAMIGAPGHCGEIGPVAGVGELVDGEHLIAPHPDQMAHQGRTDEASAASNDDFHAVPYPSNAWPPSTAMLCPVT